MKIIIFFIFAFVVLNAQETEKPYSAGFIFGLNQVYNYSEIPLIPLADDCGFFRDGEDNSYHIGFNFAYKLNQNFRISARALYDKRPANLYQETTDFEVLNPTTNQYVPFVRGHDYSAELDFLTFDVGIIYQPLNNIPVYLRPSLDIGEAFFSSDIKNTETILSPDGVLYPDQTRQAIVEQGELIDATTSFGASLALGADFYLKNRVRLSPEISYRYGLTSIRSEHDWNQNVIRLSLVAAMDFGGDTEPLPQRKEAVVIQQDEEEDVVVEEIPLEDVIEDISVGEIVMLETIVTQTYPILPYIFFDEANSEIKKVYTENNTPGNLIESDLPKDNLKIYYRLLDIIGYRLKNNPSLTIELIGVTDGKELPTREERIDLARNRAETIADYLFDNWNLNKEQIVISADNVPALATNPKYAEGNEENRRVEIASRHPEIFEPVVHSQFLEYTALNSQALIDIEISSAEEIESYNVNVVHNGSVLSDDFLKNTFETERSIGNNILVKDELEKLIQNDLKNGKNQLEVQVKVETKSGRTETKYIPVPIDIEKDNFELGRLNLIVFDFDKADITNENKDMIKKFINTSIKEKSTVQITGSTDKLGEKDYNKSLSLSRAKSVEQFILIQKPDANITEVKGLGDQNLLFDNNLPEGRFYCRTVLVEVVTPIE